MRFDSVQSFTLGDAVLGQRSARSWVRDAGLVVAFSLLIALTAQIEVPAWPVPFTLQTLGVLLTGAVLGSRRGALSIMLYLVEGAAGLPVFAGGAGGAPYLWGPTGGYLVGFVAAAWLVGALAERGWDRRLPLAALAMVLGNVVIYAFGVAWLAVVLGSLQKAIAGGMVPFLVGDLAKIALAAGVLPGAWKLVRRTR